MPGCRSRVSREGSLSIKFRKITPRRAVLQISSGRSALFRPLNQFHQMSCLVYRIERTDKVL